MARIENILEESLMCLFELHVGPAEEEDLPAIEARLVLREF